MLKIWRVADPCRGHVQSATLRGDMAPPLPPALTHLLATRGEVEAPEPAHSANAEPGAATDGQVCDETLSHRLQTSCGGCTERRRGRASRV